MLHSFWIILQWRSRWWSWWQEVAGTRDSLCQEARQGELRDRNIPPPERSSYLFRNLPAGLEWKTTVYQPVLLEPLLINLWSKLTLASAKPPPRRKMTPQHIFVSMSRQVIKDGAFFRLFFIEVKGQKSYVWETRLKFKNSNQWHEFYGWRTTCGRIKRRMDMKMAGVAEPTVTRELRRVFTLKASPQPGMKIGVCNLLFTIVAADSFKLSICIQVYM